jgi:hypothetical protein
LAQVPKGVIFYNTNYEDMPDYVKIHKDNITFDMMLRLLHKGRKLNYMPGTYQEDKDKELRLIIKKLFEYGGFREKDSIILAVDEVHLYKAREVISELIRVATGGIRFGINGMWISQRPALIDNTLMSQSQGMIVFPCNMEEQYFRRYNIPYEQIENELDKKGKFSYAYYDFKNIYPYSKI